MSVAFTDDVLLSRNRAYELELMGVASMGTNKSCRVLYEPAKKNGTSAEAFNPYYILL